MKNLRLNLNTLLKRLRLNLAERLKLNLALIQLVFQLQGAFYENIFVHFDLKGAPPRVSYFVNLLKLVANSGATGMMIIIWILLNS